MSEAIITKIEQIRREDLVLAKDEEIQAEKLKAIQDKRKNNAKWAEFLKEVLREGANPASLALKPAIGLLNDVFTQEESVDTPRFRVKGNNTAVGKIMYEADDWIKPSEAGRLSGVSTDDARKVMDRLVAAGRAVKDTKELRGYRLTDLGRREWHTSPHNEKTAGQDMPAVDPIS